MSTITLRSVKGSGLTNNEIDANFTNLNTDKIEATQTVTLTNKTLALGSNTVSGTLAQFNTALSDGDFATLAGTETLTNKTLTAPVLANPSYSGATANGGTVTTIDINGGTIDGTVIGGVVPAAVSATTLSATGTTTLGNGTTDCVPLINGKASGTGGGAGVVVQNAGTSVIAVGNKSVLIGGAYDATPYLYGASTIATNVGFSLGGVLSMSGNASAGSATASWFGQTSGTPFVNAPTGTNGYLSVGNTGVATWSSTGLAVTGALSATGVATLGPTSGEQLKLRDGNYASSLSYLQTYGDGTARIRLGHYDSSLVAFPTGLVQSQILAGITMLDVAPRDIGGSVINFRAGAGVPVVATVSSTGLAVTGALSASGTSTQAAINASGIVTLSSNNGVPLRLSGATTGTNVVRCTNTGGDAYFGQENSTGGNNLIVGAAGYDTIVRGPSGIAFSANAGNAMQMRLSSTGLSVTGALSATGNVSTSAGTVTGLTTTATNGTISVSSTNDTTNGVVGTFSNHPLAFYVNSSKQATLDASGNLGLGVTPSAFPTTKTLEMPNGVMFSSWQGYSTYGILQNNYHDGVSWKYKVTNSASRFCANDGNVGGFQWYTAPSGTAGNAITFTQAMTLDASGNLGLGVTPSAFPTTKTLEMPNGVMFSSWQGYSTYGILQNNYHDGVSWKYKVTNFASRFCANDGNVGGFQWYTAPSGTAGNTITFTQAMSLDASSHLTVTGGITTGSYTVATRPAHAAGRIIHVTDGGAGAVFQGSAGGAWVNLG